MCYQSTGYSICDNAWLRIQHHHIVCWWLHGPVVMGTMPCWSCSHASLVVSRLYRGLAGSTTTGQALQLLLEWLVIGPMIVVCAGRAATNAQDTPTLLVAAQRQRPCAGIDHVSSHVAYYSMVRGFGRCLFICNAMHAWHLATLRQCLLVGVSRHRKQADTHLPTSVIP